MTADRPTLLVGIVWAATREERSSLVRQLSEQIPHVDVVVVAGGSGMVLVPPPPPAVRRKTKWGDIR